MFNDINCILKNKALSRRLRQESVALVIACHVWGESTVSDSRKSLISGTEGLTWWNKMSSLGTVYPIIWRLHLNSFYLCLYLKVFLLMYVFQVVSFCMTFQKTFTISCSSPYSLIYSDLPTPSPFKPPILV